MYIVYATKCLPTESIWQQHVYATKCKHLECLRNKMSTIQNVYIYNVFARKFIN